MPLTKSKGNMYDWVTHTHSHLRGKCPHECGYCYVQAMAKKFDNMKKAYSGPIRLETAELSVDYGQDNVIFIDHMNDLFAQEIPSGMIIDVLEHCMRYPQNEYVLQTKNPGRYAEFENHMPDEVTCGTTIESNRVHEIMGNAPSPFERIVGIKAVPYAMETFITVEPILKFDLDMFASMLIWACPDFVNIGADSKGHGLEEPTYDEIMALYERLIGAGIEVRKKINLERLQGAQQETEIRPVRAEDAD